MKKSFLVAKVAVYCLTVAVVSFSTSSPAVTIVSGPSFTPALNAPLAGQLQLATDVSSRVSVSVNDGTGVWERDFYDFATSNAVPLYGFKPGRTNLIQVTVYDQNRNAYAAPQLLTFVTAPLPSDFPKSKVLTSDPSRMEPGYTLFTIDNRYSGNAYITIVDNQGQVVWYRKTLQSGDVDVEQLADGNLFIHESPPANRFVETDLLGNTNQIWVAPASYPVNAHVGFITDHGTILYLSDISEVVSNFPNYTLPVTSATSTNVSVKTVFVDDNPVVEISASNSALLHVWSALNLLDPTRVTYLTGDAPSPLAGTLDTMHANAIVDDPSDNAILVSLRDQNTIYKFSRATGQLIWILAPPAGWPASLQRYLLTPVGAPFEWSYGQHAPEYTPQGTLLLFDDGEWRASPFDPALPQTQNYSRAVEYSIDETNMTISQVWDSYDSGQGGGDRIYSTIMGNADWLPQQGNVLTTFAFVNYTNGVLLQPSPATMSRIVEYTHEPVPQVVFDLSFWFYDTTPTGDGYFCYRSHRIPDLYAHPAKPVTNLVIGGQDQTLHLEFSADPTFSYAIQSSTDLTTWTTIGPAIPGENAGDFDFADSNDNQVGARFYRVVTQ